MREKACCVLGYTNISPEKMETVKEKLKQEIEQAVADGFTTFITGMDKGTGLICAQLVIEQKQQQMCYFGKF